MTVALKTSRWLQTFLSPHGSQTRGLLELDGRWILSGLASDLFIDGTGLRRIEVSQGRLTCRRGLGIPDSNSLKCSPQCARVSTVFRDYLYPQRTVRVLWSLLWFGLGISEVPWNSS